MCVNSCILNFRFCYFVTLRTGLILHWNSSLLFFVGRLLLKITGSCRMTGACKLRPRARFFRVLPTLRRSGWLLPGWRCGGWCRPDGAGAGWYGARTWISARHISVGAGGNRSWPVPCGRRYGGCLNCFAFVFEFWVNLWCFYLTIQSYEKFSKYKSLKGILSHYKSHFIYIFSYLCNVITKTKLSINN